MKKSLKIIAVAAGLGLCLLLTGCYVPPDDVNNTGSSTSNEYPFDTLQPTATVTVTPDTVTVDDNQGQNVFNNPQGNTGNQGTQATPTPESGPSGWTDFGSPQNTGTTPIPTGVSIVLNTAGTGTPEPGTTIAVVTSEPPSASPTTTAATPSPTPPSLQLGFKGSEAVRALQKRLKELGYYKGAVDGDFGENTEKAVKEFQKANGLTPDGKAGEKTLAKMNAKNAVSYKQAHATATPKVTPTKKVTPKPTAKPTATPNLSKDYYLSAGSSGSKVETLQKRLIELGWLDGKATGTYDAATEEAVRAFQRKTSGLWEDGIAGPDTLKKIYASDAAKTGNPAASTGETLEFGSSGNAVKKLQQKLKDLGYLSGTADGKFGTSTQAAVIAFQKNNGLTADGKAGTATLNRLYSGNAKKANGNPPKVSEKNKGGRDTDDIASTGYETLQNGSSGSAVRKLQEKLKKLGYYNGNVDGNFGDGTEAAVMAFQMRNNLTVDGKAGPATQRVLYGTAAKSPVTYSALRKGDSGTAVRNLQYTLYELGYYDGSIDGDYGQTTEDAVRAFQIRNNITPVDGVAGNVTLSRMYSKDAIPATKPSDEYETVRPGESGEMVVQIQECLVELELLDAVTGIYDDATTEAVKAFQTMKGLDPDGICGIKTLQMLFGT